MTYVDNKGNNCVYYSRDRHNNLGRIGEEETHVFWRDVINGEVVRDDMVEGKLVAYRPDFKILKNGKMVCYCESETKSEKNWKYIVRGIHIPARKEKIFEYVLGIPEDFVFLMFNWNLQECLIISKKTIDFLLKEVARKSEEGVVDEEDFCKLNKYDTVTRSNSTYFQVPYENVDLFIKENDKWKKK